MNPTAAPRLGAWAVSGGAAADPTVPMRHPLDPDPVRSSKAVAVLILGVVALLTGPMVGGVIPATLALLLARSTRAEMAEAAGFLTGVRYVRWGETLAWIGIVLAATALVVASIVGLMHVAATPPGPHLDPNTN